MKSIKCYSGRWLLLLSFLPSPTSQKQEIQSAVAVASPLLLNHYSKSRFQSMKVFPRGHTILLEPFSIKTVQGTPLSSDFKLIWPLRGKRSHLGIKTAAAISAIHNRSSHYSPLRSETNSYFKKNA